MANFSDNLVGHWLMNDDLATTAVLDTTGVNDGVLNVNTDTISVAGKINKALDFDGVDDYVNVPRNINIEPQNLTLGAWIKPSAVDGNRVIFDKPYTAMSNPYYSYELRIYNGTIHFMVVVGSYSDDDIIAGGTIVANNWYHIVATFDGTMRLYINGVLIAEKSNPGDISYFDKPLTIGNGQNYSAPFEGIIDDVRIYDTALTPYYIKLLYNNGAGTEDENIQSNTLLLGCNF